MGMTKQEETTDINKKRETILNFIRAWGVIKHPYGSKDAEGCLAMLSDLGIVIKVDGELPQSFYHVAEGGDFEQQAKRREFIAGERMRVSMTNAGYVAAESLIDTP